jgi:hypothetical protein
LSECAYSAFYQIIGARDIANTRLRISRPDKITEDAEMYDNALLDGFPGSQAQLFRNRLRFADFVRGDVFPEPGRPSITWSSQNEVCSCPWSWI